MAAREQGIQPTEYAVLEADGKVSFFTYEDDDSSSGAPEKPPQG